MSQTYDSTEEFCLHAVMTDRGRPIETDKHRYGYSYNSATAPTATYFCTLHEMTFMALLYLTTPLA